MKDELKRAFAEQIARGFGPGVHGSFGLTFEVKDGIVIVSDPVGKNKYGGERSGREFSDDRSTLLRQFADLVERVVVKGVHGEFGLIIEFKDGVPRYRRRIENVCDRIDVKSRN